MGYVDGFVLPVPKKHLGVYRGLARKMGKIFKEYGALDFKECVGDDLKVHCGVPFPRRIRLKRGETVVFSWVVFKSRKDRDRINAKVMKDPRVTCMDPAKFPFDMERMLYGGFKILVDL